MNRAPWLEEILRSSFRPEHLEVEDESGQHAGHEGARGGGAHFRVVIVSSHFQGHGRVARQRMVYESLGTAMGKEVHALALRTLTPEEWRREGSADGPPGSGS